MQHPITNRSDNTSNRQSICATGLHQNLNRAFVLFELTPANEISLLDPYERTLGKCCVDPLRPPRLSGCGKAILGFVVPVGLCAVMQPLRAKYTCTVPPDINVTLSHDSDIPFPITQTHPGEQLRQCQCCFLFSVSWNARKPVAVNPVNQDLGDSEARPVGSEQGLRNRLRGNKRGSSDVQEQPVGTPKSRWGLLWSLISCVEGKWR